MLPLPERRRPASFAPLATPVSRPPDPARPMQHRRLPLLPLALAATLLTASPAAAQLRPLDPVDWRVFDAGTTLTVEAGGAWLDGQRASLAGVEGTAWEAGNLRLAWRSGRVAIVAGGTVQRFLTGAEPFAEPLPETEPDPDGDLHDTGDWRIATLVRLTPEGAPAAALLRFGTRLPTTDNRVGLDRDATDFFATLGGRIARGAASFQAEAGVSINGTRVVDYEQSDALVFAARAAYRLGPVVPSLAVAGQMDGKPGTVRGNEDLGEVRLGLTAGERRWLRVELVRGFQPFSPDAGVIVAAGVAR